MNNRLKIQIACTLLALAIVPMSLFAQTAPATSMFNYPGGGVIMAGDISEGLLPQGASPSYSDVTTFGSLGVRTFVRIGNVDRNWSTPDSHWPAGYPLTPYWYKNIMVMVYDPDTTWNRSTMPGGAANPSYFANPNAPGTLYNPCANLTFKSTLQGATDASRTYSREPYYVDGTRRQHVVYEAGWVTNLGIDVQMRAHGFAAPNWNNLNDFVIIEVQLKNTGVLDVDMNGVPEQLNHDIKALALQMSGESYMSVQSYAGGGRNNNDIVPTINARQTAWIDDLDDTGSPWAFEFVHANPTVAPPVPAGKNDLGFLGGNTKNYLDNYYGWVMLDVKAGALPANRAQSAFSLPTKNTIFGTHPIGVGPQRGWYVSSGSCNWVESSSNPYGMYITTTGVFFQDGGRNAHQTQIGQLNLNPNANLFDVAAAGTVPGNQLTFVPKPVGSQTRPDGDSKSSGIFEQPSYEDGHADATTLYPTGWGTWTKGMSNTENFNGDNFSGVGPFSIPKDSTITIVFATVAGYRLEGIQRSVRAARWAYQQNYVLPLPPPLPDMKVSNTLQKSTNVEWNGVAETDPEFAGYKIWRSAQFKKVNYLDEGMRIVDRYQEQMTPGARPSTVFKPVNPKFDAFGITQGTALKGSYQPDTWGTWDLVKTIAKADLGTLPVATSAGFKYRYEDKDVILGFTYWYYVSAYKEGTYTGPEGETTNRIETHYSNRNGADGLWHLTYPFGFNNPAYPKDAAGLKAIGAAQVVYSALAPNGDVSTVGVRPNPYKRAALHDNRTLVYDHKLLFYNLPPSAKITILDVSGQVIDVINFTSNDASKGSVFWDMFSKDGIEVASGVYIYVVESPTNSKVGHFAILR